MYENKEFVIDKNSENYRAVKTTAASRIDNQHESEDDNEEEEELPAIKPKGNLNNLFAGKEEDESVHGEDSDNKDLTDNFEKKMSKD
jgi:hypothetical protein